jgi:hypothetical protein
MALAKSTKTVKDAAAATFTIVTANDGTNDLSAVGVLGGDGAHFLPPMDDPARPGYVALVAGEAHLGAVGGNKVEVAVEITRPADTTAYAAGDSVNTSTTVPTVMTFANFARVNGGSGYITKARLVTDKKSITPRVRVHLFNAANPQLTNDNAAFIDLYADDAKKIGFFDLPAMTTSADTTNSTESRTLDFSLRIPFVAGGATRSIFALLETLDGFTPASGEKFTLTLLADLD